jgi:hypothetical protein
MDNEEREDEEWRQTLALLCKCCGKVGGVDEVEDGVNALDLLAH